MMIVMSPSVLSPSHLYSFFFKPKQPLPYFAVFPSFSSLAKNSKASPYSSFYDYLIQTFKFSEAEALSISTHFCRIKSIENAHSVFKFLQSLGLSNSHIQSAIRVSPKILSYNVEKSLKPKIKFFQDMGIVDSDLAPFISKNSRVLTASLEKKLVPLIEILKKVLLDDENNKDLVKVINRCNWLIRSPESILLSNITFLQSCGIVGSQLSMLLKREPRLFVRQESTVRDLVSRAINMGFSVNSKMLVHGLYTLSGLSDETLERKFGFLKSFGFSEHECLLIFRKAPYLLGNSEERLKLGIDFFLNTVKLKKEVLVRMPVLLMYSMDERVFPRYKVLEIIKSKKLLKKELSFITVLHLSEENFLQKFISRFPDETEELLGAYKGHTLDTSSKEKN